MFAVIATAPAAAVEYIDIDQPVGPGSIGFSHFTQQTFVPEANNITAVSLYFTSEITGNVSVQIRDAICGDILAHGTETDPAIGWVKFNLVGAQALVPDNVYVIYFDASAVGGANLAMSEDNPYADGARWAFCTTERPTQDLQFRTWADQEAVPAEETAWSAVKSLYR
jgi:hypothetical protein